MSCEPENVTGFVDGELDAEGRARVAAHLEACAACREQAADERELRARLSALPPPDLPAGLEERLRETTLEGVRPGLVRWALPLAAALVLGVWARGYTPFVAWELVRDHRHCFSRTPLPAEVTSHEPQVVSAWFGSRGTRLPALPQEAGRARLAGGRYCPLPSLAWAAHVYYLSPGGGVSVFIVPHHVRVGGRFTGEVRGAAVRLVQVDGDVVGIVGDDGAEVRAVEAALGPPAVARLGPLP